MKTTIKQTGPREVTLSYEDPFNGPVSREFFCPSAGAYVREWDARRKEWNQNVCAGLANTGWTLTATPETLLAVVRREWRQNRRALLWS